MTADPVRRLPLEQVARIERAVATSGDPVDGEIVRQALRLWEQHADVGDLETLKLEYAAGKASGEPQAVNPVQFLKDLKAERTRRAGL